MSFNQSKEFKGVATNLRQEGPTIVGRYHNTDVVKYDQAIGAIQLNTGGYFTNTTKNRMNAFANQFCNAAFSVYQKDFTWYVKRDNCAEDLVFESDSITFSV